MSSLINARALFMFQNYPRALTHTLGCHSRTKQIRRHHQQLLRLNLLTPRATQCCLFLCHPLQMPPLPHPTWAHRPKGQTAEQDERLNACAALALHSKGALLQATHKQQTLASPRHAAPASAHPLHNSPWTSPDSEQARTCPRVTHQQQQQQQHERSDAQGAALGCICAGLERKGRGHALEVKIPPAHAEFERPQHNVPICTTERRDRCLQTMPYQLNLASLKNAWSLILSTPFTEPPKRSSGSFLSRFRRRSTAAGDSRRGYLCGMSEGA